MLFLKILIGFLLALLLIFLFLLVIKIKIWVIAKNGALKVQLKVLGFSFTVYPNKFGHRKKEKKEELAAQSNQEEPEQNETEKPKYGEMVDAALDLLHEMENAVTIETLLISLIIATDNAAKTGLMLGQISAAAGIVIPYLYSHFDIRNRSISIDADFMTNKSRWDIELVASTRTIKLLFILKHNYKKLMKFFKK